MKVILKGLDEAWQKVNPTQAYADGYRFAVGYVSQDNTGKNFTTADIAALLAAGISPAIVYEYNPQSAGGGAASGANDAGIAVSHATAINAPQGMALYAAVDWDVTDAQKPAVLAYAKAFQEVCATVGYRSGIYGGYWVCKYLSENGYTGFLWQTYAWSGGQWWPTAAIRQTQNGIHEAGADVDLDESEIVDFGQWPATPVTVPVSNPTPSNEVDMSVWHTVKRGDNGGYVKIAQGLLIGHNYPVGSRNGLPDGDFGSTTEASTRSFQSSRGIVVDGIFGPITAGEAIH